LHGVSTAIHALEYLQESLTDEFLYKKSEIIQHSGWNAGLIPGPDYCTLTIARDLWHAIQNTHT
jgi:hypothetical protein